MPPQDTVAYYDAVVKTMGGLEKTREFYRFFLAPGMGHCSGGPGPNQFDHLTALEQWIEKGDRAGQDDRDAQHRRQGRSHAAAVRLPAGRALEGHRQQRRSGELLVRRRAGNAAGAEDDDRTEDSDESLGYSSR